MGEFEAKRCRGKWHQSTLILPGWGSILPFLLQESPERRLAAATQKLSIVCGLDVPLAFTSTLHLHPLAAGCMTLTSRDCINRLMVPAAIELGQWQHQQEIRGGEDSEAGVSLPLAPRVRGLQEAASLVLLPALRKQASLRSPLFSEI